MKDNNIYWTDKDTVSFGGHCIPDSVKDIGAHKTFLNLTAIKLEDDKWIVVTPKLDLVPIRKL